MQVNIYNKRLIVKADLSKIGKYSERIVVDEKSFLIVVNRDSYVFYMHKTDKTKNHLMKKFKDSFGNPCVQYSKKGNRVVKKVKELMALAYIPDVDHQPKDVKFFDNNRENCKVENIYIDVTPSVVNEEVL